MADIIRLILEDFISHVVIFPNVFFIRTGLSLFMILQLDITGDPVFFQIQQVLFTAVPLSAVTSFRQFSPKVFLCFSNTGISVL